MTTTLLAHFDGKQALVLDEPADLPVGTPLRVHVESVPQEATSNEIDVLSPVIVGMDPNLSRAIAHDPEFVAENMSQCSDPDMPHRLPLALDVESIRAIVADPEQAWRPLDIDINPELGRIISENPEFNIEES